MLLFSYNTHPLTNFQNWKARVSAYEDLAKAFPTFEEDKEFTKYGPLIKKFVLDTNAAAQEKGLAAVLAYVDYCPAAGKVVESVVAALAAKCLNSTRAKTRELAVDIVLMCVEIERQEAVLEELLKALDQKTPKNVAAVVRMIKQALNLFGSKVIAIKPIVPVSLLCKRSHPKLTFSNSLETGKPARAQGPWHSRGDQATVH